ncbi:uncharacterized protein LOC134225251 [Armigeres subalbatus]|uniref:uncharacterized protein LOC134225251 n=1 Tax=Armigeres subalbatus TaxID=124917 RepID=UPI002ED31E06
MSGTQSLDKSVERRTLRDILLDGCISTENGFMLCAINSDYGCKYRQKCEKFDPGNFIRHIRCEHPILAKARGLVKEDGIVPVKRRKVSKLSIVLDRQILLEAVIKLVTIHHVPILCVEWEGLRLILDPICDALKMQLNRPNMLNHLTAAAAKIRSGIANEVKGKLVCLKIDSATRLGRHILGVNIQFFHPEQNDILIYTIERSYNK